MKKLFYLLIIYSLIFPCFPSFASDDYQSKEAVKKLATVNKSLKLKKSTLNEPDSPMKQYLLTVFQKIHLQWVMPNNKKFDENLEAVVLITIQNTGNVESVKFEKKSTDNLYNNYVVDTILSSNPLPKFPPEFNKESMGIGLRFKPGELKTFLQ